MKRCNLVIIALLFCLASPSDATIYKWVDDNGETHFTDDLNKIPEKAKENAQDFDKIEHQGSATYDPDLKSPEPETGEEPFWKRYLQQEEKKEQAKRSQEPKITLYMADWWPACRAAKSYFVKNGIAFTEVNVDKDSRGHQEMLQKTGGYSGIPVIDIDGTILKGFSQRAIEKALNR